MKRKKLLIIDDNDKFSILVKFAFEYDNDWEVLTASNVKDGISQAQVYQPNMILLDIEMPKQNGFDGYKMLKENWATKLVPIVLVTGMERVKDKVHSYIREEIHIIIKPLSVIKLKYEIIKVWEYNFAFNNE